MSRVTTSILGGVAGALLLALPAAAAAKTAAMRNVWPAETISGKIEMVQPGEKLIVVKGPNDVPYDLVVTGKTRVEAGNRPVALKDLPKYENQQVSIRFVPERGGDVARSIQIAGS